MNTLVALKRYSYYIGIDPGKDTGYALYEKKDKRLIEVRTMLIHEAMDELRKWLQFYSNMTLIRIEDARKRKVFGKTDRERLQGAGSIKRDCIIWEDFLKDLKANFEMVAPRDNKTKMKEPAFLRMTGWKGRSSNHARDAATLVYGY